MEDLNYCLITKESKYLIKILNQNRNKAEFKDYIEKHKIIERNEIKTPKIIGIYEEKELVIIIMEYIEGQDLYSSNESITRRTGKDIN